MAGSPRHAELVNAAQPSVFWSDRDDAPEPAPPLAGTTDADLVIIGAGFTGLWAALQAAEAEPGRAIVVLEAEVAGFGASSRNGGFCEASLTHGLWNGLNHWPDEINTLQRMGAQNLDQLVADLERHGIDAEVERTGQLHLAVQPWQVDDLREGHELALAHGERGSFLDTDQVRAEVHSDTYLAGVHDPDGAVMVHPARLAWGLRGACVQAGVRFHDHTRVTGVEGAGNHLSVRTAGGEVRADRVVVATNAWAQPVRKIRRWVIPIYDHVLMTEPLSPEQMSSIGWERRQGLADAGNQFHYYRLTSDDRILWGGWDANYHKGNAMGPAVEAQTHSHALLADHFFQTFPQLEGLGFSHRWAGPIGTTSKFTAAFGRGHDDRLSWVAGYTGLGVGASRWGARVALDLVDGLQTERTELRMVKRKPLPFPPEPLRNPLVQFTRSQIARADANEGKPGAWLRLLDVFGVGFDS
jgi:glycine/D-amino acid oxidase-like deaminating enzyme